VEISVEISEKPSGKLPKHRKINIEAPARFSTSTIPTESVKNGLAGEPFLCYSEQVA